MPGGRCGGCLRTPCLWGYLAGGGCPKPGSLASSSDVRTEARRGTLISHGCPARPGQSWAQNFACGPLPHVGDLGLQGDFHKCRPSSHLETQAQTLQSRQTVWAKWEGPIPLTAAPETRLPVPPPPNSPGDWEVSRELSEKGRGRQTAEQSQSAHMGISPAACGEGVHPAPRLATGHSAGWTLR